MSDQTMVVQHPAQLLVQSTCGSTMVMDIPRSEWTNENKLSVNSIIKLVVDLEGIPQSAIRLTSGTHDMRPNQELTAEEWVLIQVRALPTVRILLGLAGGKGGFGAMLRNLGKNIDTKNMNYDACRDLSGRRMRHVSNEKKLKDWFHHQEDREAEEKQTKDEAKQKHRREKRELQRELLENATHGLVEETNAVTEVLGAAVQQGLKKRKVTNNEEFEKERAAAEASDVGSDEDLFGDVELPAKKARLQELEADHAQQEEAKAKEEATAAAAAAAEQALAAAQAQKAVAAASEAAANSGAVKRGRSNDDEEQAPEPVELQQIDDEQALVELGMAQLAAECRRRGLKAGGTVAERAKRLWAVRGPPELVGDDVPIKLRAAEKRQK